MDRVVDEYVEGVERESFEDGYHGRLDDSRVGEGKTIRIFINSNDSLLEQKLTLIHELMHFFFDWFYEFPVDLCFYRARLKSLGSKTLAEAGAADEYFQLLEAIDFAEEWAVEEETWRFYLEHRAYGESLFLRFFPDGGG